MLTTTLWSVQTDMTFRGAWNFVSPEDVCLLGRRGRLPVMMGIDRSGRIQWEREFEFDSVHAFSPFEGYLYLDGFTIQKLRPADGAIVTVREMDDRVEALKGPTIGPLFYSPTHFLGIEPNSLETRWSWAHERRPFVLSDPLLIAYEQTGEITIVNVAENMSVSKASGPPRESLGMGARVVDNLLVQMDFAARYAVDLETGQMAWRKQDLRHAAGEHVAFGDRVAYSNSGDVMAIDLTTGEEIWRSELPHRVETPSYLDSGTIYVGTKGGGIHALDAETGRTMWSFEVGYDPVGVWPRFESEIVTFGWEVVSCHRIDAT